MWNNEEEVNENGEFVKLYIPIQAPPRLNNNASPPDSHIGGHSSHEEDAPVCTKCQLPMYLLVELRSANTIKNDGTLIDRSLCVFGCPRARCSNLMFKKGFSSGGQGVMCCKIRETPVVAVEKPAPVAPAVPAKSSWYTTDDDEADNDWGMDVGGDAVENFSNLESAVAAMENKLENGDIVKSKKKETQKIPISKAEKGSSDAFNCYILTQQDEPLARGKLEEDDVGMSASDEKVRNMLARYMAEEEDEEILAALRGADIGGGGFGEEDERLSPKERQLLGFQDRLRRAPRQVVRCARGGIPIWSIPSEKKGKPLYKVPPCACGSNRAFDFQLLPSLLHVLAVDKHSGAEINNVDGGIGGLLTNGMNWGSVAVYTCQNSCDESEGMLVVQESVDERPESRKPQESFEAIMAVVENMDDDAEFQPDA